MKNESKGNLNQIANNYLFVDLETGGLYADKHSILQIAAIFTDLDFNIQSYFMSYVNPHPELKVTKEALLINQLKWEDLVKAPSESAVALALHHFASMPGQKARFAGYNCQFDLEFLSLMWKRQNVLSVPYQVPWLDLYAAAKSKLGNNSGLPNFKLVSVANHFGINVSGAHDALQDLFMTIEIAKLLKAMPDNPHKDRGIDVEAAKFSLLVEEAVAEICDNTTNIISNKSSS